MFPTNDVYVTCAFGVPGSWAAGRHTGTDFRAPVGTPIQATKGGTVVHSGHGGYGEAYGYHIILSVLTRTGSSRRVLYAHMSSSSVRVGQKVKMGDTIGRSGNTGNTTGPHLHYEERVSTFGYWDYAKPIFLSYHPITRVTVHLSNVQYGKKNREVRRVQRRLNRRVSGQDLPLTGLFKNLTKEKYSRWQKQLGFSGKDANGIPGRTSLERLGFRVLP